MSHDDIQVISMTTEQIIDDEEHGLHGQYFEGQVRINFLRSIHCFILSLESSVHNRN